MKFLKTLGVALTLPALSVQATDFDFVFDYGYPPPQSDIESFGTVRIGADWLYLRPAVDDLYFGEIVSFIPGQSGSIQRVAPRLKWDSGVQLNVGIDLPCDVWALNASWMYYRTAGTRSASFKNEFILNFEGGKINDVLFDLTPPAVLGLYTTSGNWSWSFNQLDIDFSRVSYFNRAVSIRPVAGFRFLWSQQSLNTLYSFVPSADDTAMGSTIRNKNDFNAFGLKFGVDTTWDVGFDGISLYGNIDFALLVGNLRIRQDVVLTEEGSGIQPFDLKSHPRSLKEMITASFGLQWVTTFNCDTSRLVVKAGWEEIYFPNFSTLIGKQSSNFVIDINSAVPVSRTIRSDMGLYGLVLGADYYF